jgi:hypothetical protein
MGLLPAIGKRRTMSENVRSSIVLSVNRALVGEVFPELIAVSCMIASETQFELVFHVDSILTDSKADDISCIETEVIADFPGDFEISHKVIVSNRADLPSDGFWIFLRKSA